MATEKEILAAWHERQLLAGGEYAERWRGVSAEEMLAGELPPGEIHTEQWLYEQGAIRGEDVLYPELFTRPIETVSPVLTGGVPMVYGGDGNKLFDGQATLLPDFPMPGAPVATQVGFGELAAGALAFVIPLILSLVARGKTSQAAGIAKSMLGKSWFKILLGAVAAGLISMAVVNMLKKGGRGRSRRYSIGANPRLNTLLKVAKRVDNIFVAYDRRVRKYRGRTRPRALPAHAHTVTSRRR